MIMNEPFEHLYFNWLYAKVAYTDVRTPATTYYNLFRILHQTEFAYLLSGDDNRAEDGKELRREFIFAGDFPDDVEWRTLIPCSMLEMLVAFSIRAAYMADGLARDWFWEFLDNLGFRELSDDVDISVYEVQEKIDSVIWRSYESSGYGGMFPLRDPMEDQTKVEIWYQFCQYLVDHDRLD